VANYPFSSALVTGASSGIGEAIAHALGHAQVPTVLVARRADRLQQIADCYPGFSVLVADLTDPADLERVAQRISSVDEPIELVVNNAGFGTTGSFHEIEADRLNREIALNVAALTRLAHAALSAMIPRHRGYVLNVSSVLSFQPAAKLAVYAATKAYVTSLSESLHEETRGTGVRVTALCPGLTKTEFQSVSSGEQYASRYPKAAWLTAQAVAETGLRDVARGRALSIPGTIYKAFVATTGVVPRFAMRRLAGLVQRDV
jgi:short-subunit dehydrogenase